MGATFVIAGGYTAGHLTPGLAIAEELREKHPEIAILFAGWTDPVEADFVRRSGLSFLALPAAPWAARGPVTRAYALAALAPAFWAARRRFRAVGATSLLSLGSFAAFAPALAARSLGLPVTVFEPNARFGLANRLLLPVARRILASRLFDASAAPTRPPVEIVGVPLRSSVQALAARAPEPPSGPIHLLVVGGSLGSLFLNARGPELAGRLAARGLALRVTHQCGRGVDAGTVRAAYERARVNAVVESFLDPIAPALAAAHFVVTAGGAVTLHEVAAAGVPLLVVPLNAAAARHQHANAAAFQRATGCQVRTEEAWEDADAAETIAAAVENPARWRDQSRALQAFVSSGARAAIVSRILP